ncbi:MAG: TonB-dependent receptor family protein [Duncaniella sp.]|nr:TonB-dependent receptor family protein [Duncaniella sp.]
MKMLSTHRLRSKKIILTILLAVITCISASAYKYTYSFNGTPISEAIVKISKDHPDLNISFIYRELDNYKTFARIRTDDIYDALRQVIGFNPISIIRKDQDYYIEALQHGKFRYTGRAVGSDSEPVVAATVMLLAPKDSTVITYGITDDTGCFSIPCDRQGVIAKLTCIGYQPTYRVANSFALGNIKMNELPIQLKTVRVEADYASAYSDKTVYRPTQRQKNASQTAIDLLRYLAIPQIKINLVDKSVTTLTGSEIAIYVDGLPASSDELQGMRTADVKTIEYLDFPNNPRFGGNEHVINFIMQKYEYGGYTKLSVSENIMIGLSSRTSLYSKFSYKSMIFDLYAGASNHNIHHVGTSRFGEYKLVDKDNKDYTIMRKEEFDNSHFKYNQYPVTFRAIYDSENIHIGNTVGLNFDQSPIAETQGHLSYSSNRGTYHAYQNNQPYTTRHFIWIGAYYFILPNDFQLNLSPKANYGHTNYSYIYSSSLSNRETIDNTSCEDYYRLSGGASLYKGFSSKHSASANIYAGTNKNEVKYMGSSPYENSFSDSYAGLRLGYNFNNRRWRFDSNIALQWERNGINGKYVSELYPLINISGRYTPSNNHSLQTFFHYGANYPGESVKTPNVLQDNEFMYKTGNPDLSLSRQITFNLQYNWIANNRFTMSLYGQYFGEYNLYVPVFDRYKDGQAILKTYSSDQDYNRTQIGLSFNLRLLDGSLQLAAQPSISIFQYRGYYNLSKNPLAMNASATYYIGKLYLQASYQTADKTIQGNQGVWYRTRDFYQLQAGWGNSNWNIRISAINMFRDDWLGATQTLNSPMYSEIMMQGGTYYHRRVNLSVTYTFGYGRKVQRSNEVGEQSGGSSAILK